MKRLYLYFVLLPVIIALVGCPGLFKRSKTPEGFALVQSGTFWMGDEFEDLNTFCRPVHQVTLTYNYWMKKYEVTFAEYDAFCDEKGKTKPDDQGWGRGPRPVMLVSWWDAIAYCNRLSEKEKIPVAYRLLGEPNFVPNIIWEVKE